MDKNLLNSSLINRREFLALGLVAVITSREKKEWA